MLKYPITYTDYDGEERTEDFYFNLSKAEIMEMEMSINGGLQKLLEKMVAEKDTEKMIAKFKEIVTRAYGEKSLDGKYFFKVDENGKRLVDKFMQTEAYSNLFMKLISDADFAAKFINGILPQIDSEATGEQAPAKPTLLPAT